MEKIIGKNTLGVYRLESMPYYLRSQLVKRWFWVKKLVKTSWLDVKVWFFLFTISQKASTGDILDVSALLQQDYITWRKAIGQFPVSSPLAHLSKPLTADVCIGNGPLLRTRTVADVAFCCRSFKVGWLKPTAPFDMIKIGFSESRNKKHQISLHLGWRKTCFVSGALKPMDVGVQPIGHCKVDFDVYGRLGWMDDLMIPKVTLESFEKSKSTSMKNTYNTSKTWTETLKLSIFLSFRHYKVLKRVFQHESYVWALTVTPWCLGRNVAMSFKACHFVIGFCRTCKGHKTLGLAFKESYDSLVGFFKGWVTYLRSIFDFQWFPYSLSDMWSLTFWTDIFRSFQQWLVRTSGSSNTKLC